ncbi:murein biosynthesis integral membrane protein MurJ [Metaclostridioides mangenotii]|uniref:Probable lipid II flippase MurJ n=1 Tax=Metaclostridioides mangenotii TaxID=1540 RepID=A0ABS4E823_9FIRM|nr:murein biosynthesis integral membrane protein MurJ [Clostridioides mangenotii]MBP1854092.1 putative peptidoglycan lipid II flippase [Clostridioides mangenotii]
MSKVAKSALGLMIATLIAKVLGFGRELTLASVYGASGTSDAFLIAMNIPAVIFLAIGTSLDTAFIPLYQDIRENNGKEESNKFTNNVLNAIMLICLGFSALGIIFSPLIVKLFAVGFKGEVFNQAVYFTRVMLIGLAFLGISYIMTAYLQVNDNFVIPGLISVPNNIIVIIAIVLSAKINIHILPWGALLGLFFQFLFQFPNARKKGFKYKLFVDFDDKHLRRMLWLVLPVLIGVAVNQASTIVDRTIASTLVEGSISALNYANKLNQFVMGMFIVSISSVIYPVLSKLSTQNNKEEFKRSIKTSVNMVTLIVIPISAGAMILAHPIVKILFERGEFDARATQMTAMALVFYSIGMIGFGLRDILGKAFYSLQDTKTPMKNAILTVVLNIILNLLFVRFTNMGIAGLAFATSISAIVTIVLFFISLRKKIGAFGGKSIILVMIKSILSAAIMSAVTLLIYNVLSIMLSTGTIQEILSLSLSIGFGALSYGLCIILLKVEESKVILEVIKSKIKR